MRAASGVWVHVVDTGSVGTPVVLEAGAGGCFADWDEVARRLAPRRVVRFDRPGLGYSPYARVDRTATASAHLLAAVLDAADITGPYVLGAHSLAGLSARAFAYLYPTRVAGMVLADPTDEDLDDTALPRGFETMQQLAYGVGGGLARLRLGPAVGRAGAAAFTRTLVHPDQPHVHTALATSSRLACTPGGFRAQADAARAVAESRVQLRGLVAAGGFPSISLRVITADGPPVNRMQRRLQQQARDELHPRRAAASPRGRHLVVADSSHLVMLDRPDLLVREISDIVDELTPPP